MKNKMILNEKCVLFDYLYYMKYIRSNDGVICD